MRIYIILLTLFYCSALLPMDHAQAPLLTRHVGPTHFGQARINADGLALMGQIVAQHGIRSNLAQEILWTYKAYIKISQELGLFNDVPQSFQQRLQTYKDRHDSRQQEEASMHATLNNKLTSWQEGDDPFTHAQILGLQTAILELAHEIVTDDLDLAMHQDRLRRLSNPATEPQ